MVTILDGGMGGELQGRTGSAGGLWSAQALLEQPELVKAIHREFVDAGADVITTNTYSTVPSYLDKGGLGDRYEELTALGGRLAREVADDVDREIQVAGSIPPLSESYRSDLVPAADEAAPIYKDVVRALRPYVDFYLCETMSTSEEARTAASAGLEHGGGKPVYVAWTLNETPGKGLRSGETIEAALARLDDLDIAGYLFNCTQPEAIEVGLETLEKLTDRPLGCYPNRLNALPEGWTLDNEVVMGVRADLSVEVYLESIDRCIRAGATIVGGCCGIGPKYIEALAERLRVAA